MLIFFSFIISLHQSRGSSILEEGSLDGSFNLSQYHNFLHDWGENNTGTPESVIADAGRYYSEHLSEYNASDGTSAENVTFFSTPESCPDPEYGVSVWNPPIREVISKRCMTRLTDSHTRQNLLVATRPGGRSYQSIHGFFHITLNVSTFLSRQENITIFEVQLQKLNKSGLLDESTLTLRIGLLDYMVNYTHTRCVKGMIKRRVAVFAVNAEIQWVDPSHYECGTILSMQRWCSKNKQSFVYYLHNKGVSHLSNLRELGLYKNVKYWREYMMFFLFERWKLCANSLSHGAEICGAHIELIPYMHYKGNFWWSTCNHIVRVTNRCPLGVLTRHAAEFWLTANTGLFNDIKEVVELWHGRVTFFLPYPRYEYSCVDVMYNTSTHRKHIKRQNT